MKEKETPAHERYQFKPFIGSSHSWALEILTQINKQSAILDVGCGAGLIGKTLQENKFQNLYAVEPDKPSLEIVKKYYTEVAVDLDQLSHKNYDVLLLLDVLEHITAPADFLTKCIAYLKPGALLLVSLPNIAHWSVRFPLLFGHFNYTERGILDKTHLHFYTRRSAEKFLNSFNQLSIKKISSSIEPVEFVLPEAICGSRLFQSLAKLRLAAAHLFPGLLAYQNLFLLEKKRNGQ